MRKGTFILITGAIILGLLTDTTGIILKYKRMHGYANWARSITKSIYHADEVHPYIDREDVFLELKHTFLDGINNCVNNLGGTILICGPYGSGKSTAVAQVLDQKEAVVVVHCLQGGNDNFAVDALNTVTVILESILPGAKMLCILEDALIRLRKQHPKVVPIFVLELYPLYEVKDLENLLFLLKAWGERKLARFIVVLSPSQSALIHFTRARARCVTIGDLSAKQAKEFLTMAFMTTLQKEKGVPFCDSEILDIVDNTIPVIGRRICDLKQLIMFCQDKHCSSVQAVKSLVEIFATQEKEQCKFFLQQFLKQCPKKKAMQLFQELIKNSEVDLIRFSKVLGVDMDVKELLSREVRLFYFNPATYKVTLASHFMVKAVEEYMLAN